MKLDCECKTCKIRFTIHNLDKLVKNGGFHISGLNCPNCKIISLDFDLLGKINFESD